MTVNLTNQWQLVPSSETDNNSPLTVRLVRDAADAINNAKFFSHSPKLWSYMFVPQLVSVANSTADNWIFSFAPRLVATEFNNLRVTVGHQRLSGSGNTNWTLYCMTRLYRGASDGGQTINTSYIVPTYTSLTWTSSNSSNNFYTTESLGIARANSTRVYLMLAAQNTDNSSYSGLTSLDITPRYSAV